MHFLKNEKVHINEDYCNINSSGDQKFETTLNIALFIYLFNKYILGKNYLIEMKKRNKRFCNFLKVTLTM